MDLGAGRRGVDMGASAVRLANLNGRLSELGYHVEDLGNVPAAQPESNPIGPSNARYLPQITDTCTRLAAAVEKALGEKRFPLILGGDHSIAAGTVAGASAHFRETGRKIGLIWVDAHSDMNTPETSPSGNVHGMPLACCVGMGPRELTHIGGHVPIVDPHSVALVGIRSVDELERRNIQRAGLRVFTMRNIDEQGLRAVMSEAIAVASQGTDVFHVSFDMDSVDPREAPGVGTPVPGGLTYREAHLAMEMICDSGKMRSMDVVEVNPVIDEANRTAMLAVELILSALGKRIL
jgi:arginase